MSNGGTSGGNGGRDRTYISRDEFEVFERNVGNSFTSISESIKALTAKVDTMRTTNWSTLVAFGSLILVVAGLAASPFMRDIGRLEDQYQRTSQKLENIVTSRWTNADQAEFADESRAILDDRDDGLRREMQMQLHVPMEMIRRNREDYDRYVLPELERLERRLNEAEAELARRGAVIEKMEREQERRTERVYSEGAREP